MTLISGSCKKYLDVNSNPTQAEPSTLQDLQALLDVPSGINYNLPSLSNVVADEYYYTSGDYANQPFDLQMNHIWDPNATSIIDWQYLFQPVYISNVVLSTLPNIPVDNLNVSTYNNIKGQALFFRAFMFYHAAQLWCKPYSTDALNDPGIPIRTVPDINIKSTRSTVMETYDRIIQDLQDAINLLPETNISFSRPNKAAAFGALARTYLSMRDYANAGRFADSCLKRYTTLIDFNSLTASSSSPIDRTNVEDIFYAVNGFPAVSSGETIDTILYNTYSANDLRKTVYFYSISNGVYGYKGSYAGADNGFCGIGTDEMYLIRAEASARAGNKDAAMSDLNTLLLKRWKTNTFIPFTATDANNALTQILLERRKELFFRGTRWTDIRRLNLENANLTLKRVLNGITYTLQPNDLRTVMLIPWDAINLSGMQQNPR